MKISSSKQKVKSPKQKTSDTSMNVTAMDFVKRLEAHRSASELEKIQRYFKSEDGVYGEEDVFMGCAWDKFLCWQKNS